MLDMTGVDLSPITKKVPEFQFYSERLQPIDFQKAIKARDDWKDPFFPASAKSLIDPEMYDNEPEKYE